MFLFIKKIAKREAFSIPSKKDDGDDDDDGVH